MSTDSGSPGSRSVLEFIDSVALADEGLTSSGPSWEESTWEESTYASLTEGAAQAAVIDSNLVAWPEGTPARVKDVVAAWLFFAQRVASAQVPDKADTIGWFDAYLDVLQRTGWVLRGRAAAWHDESVVGAQVHEKILQFATVALGPVPGALALVTAALTSLQQMDADSKWITLFDRRGRDASAVGVQVASCAAASDGGASLSTVDFRIEAGRTLTQVLFFKFDTQQASMHYRGTSLELSAHALNTYGPGIQNRVDELIAGSVAAFPLA